MAKLPEEIPEEEWEARKEGNSFIIHFILFFIPASFLYLQAELNSLFNGATFIP